MDKQSKPILIVEDSPADYELALRALKKAEIHNPIIHCEDGEQALDYLHQRGYYQSADTVHPALVLLDLNLPGTDGREVLTEIKAHEVLRAIPVLILTTSANDSDVMHCYRAGSNAYIQKPMGRAEAVATMTNIKNFWLDTCVCP